MMGRDENYVCTDENKSLINRGNSNDSTGTETIS